MSEALQKAREFEARYMPHIPAQERPAFHVSGGIGWINDPNGFSLYKGEYHLFYQYHPYSSLWGPMHWGHMKTKDFIRWERLPIAMAPDTEYDGGGCFSGGAVELADGRQLLMYTGVRRFREDDGKISEIQTQCLAMGDGVDYQKYAGNPVITSADLPEGGSKADFRDPKLWLDEDGNYYAVVSNRSADGSGAILLYQSPDAIRWKYLSVLDASRNEYGKMWECPDFFPLEGKHVILVSPMEMPPMGLDFHPGFGALCIIGDYDKERCAFVRESVRSVDYGLDFYAPQTLKTPDGRRVMIAWMQNWATAYTQPLGLRLFGEMTLPRELNIRDGRLIQNPVRELEHYRRNPVVYRDVPIQTETALPGIQGRILDLTVSVRPSDAGAYRWFCVKLAKDEEYATVIRYAPEEGKARIDRSGSGVPYDIVQVREFPVRPGNGTLKIRAVMDRHSIELFFNDGEQAASLMIYTRQEADHITFESDMKVLVDIEKYELLT